MVALLPSQTNAALTQVPAQTPVPAAASRMQPSAPAIDTSTLGGQVAAGVPAGGNEPLQELGMQQNSILRKPNGRDIAGSYSLRVSSTKDAPVESDNVAAPAPKKAAAPLPPAKHFLKDSMQAAPMTFVAAPTAAGSNRATTAAQARFVTTGAGFALSVENDRLDIVAERPLGKPVSASKPPAASAGGADFGVKIKPAKVETSHAVLEFIGADASAKVEGLNPTQSKSNYFIGSDPSKWSRNLTNYTQVRTRGLYPGVDLVYYGGRQRKLEYDLVVAPGADPAQIRFKVGGSQKAVLDADGNLLLDGAGGAIGLNRPVLYQDIPGGKKAIAGSFAQIAENEFGFKAAEYDHAKPLIIDPKINLVYSTFAGGMHNDMAFDLTLDATGNSYVTGYAASQDFPVTGNAIQTTRSDIGTYTYDVIVMKFDPSGILLYSTFLGGLQNDLGLSLAVDAAGDAYVGGYTQSTDFPVTAGAFQTTSGGGQDGFFAKISPDGSQLLYSTYLGGSGDEAVTSLLLNSDGSLWMAGDASAAGLPFSANAFQKKPNGVDNVFVAKAQFSQAGVLSIPNLTFLGGSNPNEENSGMVLAVDSSGNVLIAGGTLSSDFPVTANAYEKPFPLSDGCTNSPKPNSAGTVTKFSPDLSQMLYSTVIGGSTEDQNGYPVCNQVVLTLHLDAQNNIWMVGTTGMANFPVTSNAISKQLNGNNLAGADYFIAELSADGSKELYGSYFGGTQFDYGARAAWDPSGNIWIHGNTQSTDYPVTSDALQPANAGGYDTTLTELSPDATQILYSTYFGGSGDDDVYGAGSIALDAGGNFHLAGETGSVNFPVTPDALQGVFHNGDPGADGNDVYYSVLGSGTIGAIGPLVGGNTGDMTLTVDGAGFEQGATCSLVQGGTTIASVQATVSTSDTSVSCTFALNGAATGSYDVVVNNPDGSSFTKTDGFTVQSGGQPTIWADVIGRPKIRVGSPATYYISIGNSGSVDAYFILAWFSFPTSLNYSFPEGPSFQGAGSVSDPTTGLTSSLILLPVIHAGQTLAIPVKLTSSTSENSIPMTIVWRAPWYDSSQQAISELAAAMQNPASLPTSCQGVTGKPYLQDCLGYWTNVGVDNLSSSLTTPQTISQIGAPVVSLFKSDLNTALTANSELRSTSFSMLTNAQALRPNDGGNSGFFYGWFDSLADFFNIPIPGDQRKVQQQQPEPPPFQCTGSTVTAQCANPSQYVTCDVTCGQYAVCIYTADATTLQNCNSNVTAYCADIRNNNRKPVTQPQNFFCPAGSVPSSRSTLQIGRPLPVESFQTLLANPHDGQSCSNDPGPSGGGGGGSCGSSGGSIDPNYKAGPTGDGSASQYVNGVTPLHYNVGFENEPTATLPAAQVVVTDQLDPTKVDLTALTLGTIAFGSNIINLPTGTTNYNTDYPLSSTLHVRIQGSLNASTGLLKWTFTSIDPTTGLPPTDPTVGFLPPDTDGIVGQGSVLFNVMPKAGQSTGTQVTNMATVVFDTNAAINTPTWLNTLDVDPPVSAVTALPTDSLATFNVAWSGTDKGSGIATYTIYVSDNGGAFTVWQSAVTATSAGYSGTVGHTYGFYSIATDGAGNVEAAKTQADTSTMAVSQIVPEGFTIGANPGTLTTKAGTTASATITVTPAGGFNQAVTFGCAGAPVNTVCSFSPASVTPSGAAVATTLTLTTDAGTTAASRRPQPPFQPGRGGETELALLALGLIGMLRERRRMRRLLGARAWHVLLVGCLFLGAAATSLIGCGGGSGSASKTPITPPGTSTVTVTATSGSVSETATIQFTVQ